MRTATPAPAEVERYAIDPVLIVHPLRTPLRLRPRRRLAHRAQRPGRVRGRAQRLTIRGSTPAASAAAIRRARPPRSAPGGRSTTSAGSPSTITAPRSRSMARLQYSVTQAMSWVTRTTALAALDELDDPRLRLRPERRVAGREDLVEQQDVRVDRGRDREPEPRPHPRRVRLQRRIDELAEVGEFDDRRAAARASPVVEAQERAAEQDVVAAGQLLVEAGAQGQQADTWPRTSTAPSDGRMIPARTWSRVLLPAPFGPMTASDSPWASWSDTWRSAQNVLGRRRARGSAPNDRGSSSSW